MAKAGRKPKPAALRLADGTHRKDRHGDPGDVVQPAAADISAPRGLGKEGRAAWKAVAEQLAELGVYTQVDRGALETYCRIHDEIAKCDQKLKKDGETTVASTGTLQQHPAVNQRFKWLALKIRYEAEFGLTPSSRNGVSGKKKESNVAKRQRA